ncbi:Antigenic thaumatin-like protein [Penicillium herquei]|nr:Antigenic thaumatin-like protein [Penicillium herquei]
MKISSILSILPLATLATCFPATQTENDQLDEIPYGAFPDPSESFVLYPTPIPGVTPDTTIGLAQVGHAVVINHCKFPVYIWSVGSSIKPVVTMPSQGRYSETFHRDVGSGGIAIKISTKHDGLLTSSPLTIFAYNLAANGQVWYDLSDVFGDPFKGHRVSLSPASPEINWADGIPRSGSAIRVHSAASDLVLTLC